MYMQYAAQLQIHPVFCCLLKLRPKAACRHISQTALQRFSNQETTKNIDFFYLNIGSSQFKGTKYPH